MLLAQCPARLGGNNPSCKSQEVSLIDEDIGLRVGFAGHQLPQRITLGVAERDPWPGSTAAAIQPVRRVLTRGVLRDTLRVPGDLDQAPQVCEASAA